MSEPSISELGFGPIHEVEAGRENRAGIREKSLRVDCCGPVPVYWRIAGNPNLMLFLLRSPMCGRFTLRANSSQVRDAIRVDCGLDLSPRYNIAPTQDGRRSVEPGKRTGGTRVSALGLHSLLGPRCFFLRNSPTWAEPPESPLGRSQLRQRRYKARTTSPRKLGGGSVQAIPLYGELRFPPGL